MNPENALTAYAGTLETMAKVGEVILLIFVLTLAIGVVVLVLYILLRQGNRADSKLSKEQHINEQLASAFKTIADGYKTSNEQFGSQQAVSKQMVQTLVEVTENLSGLKQLTTTGNTKISNQVSDASEKLDKLIAQGNETLALLRNYPPTDNAELRKTLEEFIETVKREKRQTTEAKIVIPPAPLVDTSSGTISSPSITIVTTPVKSASVEITPVQLEPEPM